MRPAASRHREATMITRLPLLLLAAWLSAAAPALAAETSVAFPTFGSDQQIPATLIRPEGNGPFPAVVVMHDCSGLGPRSSGSPRRWADQLVPRGYAVLIPDSFGPRGLPNGVCTEQLERSRAANWYIRSGDAYGALAYLRTLPFVDGRRVGIMGGSHGGSSALASMVEPVSQRNPLFAAKRDGFAAGIALYPSCTAPYGGWSTARTAGAATGPAVSRSGLYKPIAPLLILAGEKDDWTPAEPCRWLAETSQAAGHPVSLKIYPGAHHSFDSAAPVRYVAARNNGSAPSGKGATTGGDPAAWADARAEVAAFFARHLKR
jgi:dienelactone hydrolase